MKWESCLHRDRLRSACLSMPIPSLQKLVAALRDEFPILQYLRIEPLTRRNTHLILPTTFEVPHLRHLILNHFAPPIRSTLLHVTTVIGIVTLTHWWIHPSTYHISSHKPYASNTFPPPSAGDTREWLPFSRFQARVIQRQLLHMPIVTHVTLPDLH